MLNGTVMIFRRVPFAGSDSVAKLTALESELTMLAGQHKTSRSRGGQQSIADELTRLAEVRDEGIIDESDWGRAKDLFLGKVEDERDRAARELRQLYDLHRSGVLSQSEFNIKKWDVLARTK